MDVLLLGGPGKPIDLSAELADGIANIPAQRRLRAGVAYVTMRGILHLDKAVDWDLLANSEWIVGLDRGTTEPDAIRFISELPGARVRVYLPERKLSAAHLLARPKFHPKFVHITSSSSKSSLFASGSANLTGPALYSEPANFEVGTILKQVRGFPPPQVKLLDAWWRVAWKESHAATPSLIEQYSKLRKVIQKRNPDLQITNASLPETPTEGDTFWIETKAMTAGARNQLELGREPSSFFGPPHASKKVIIVAEGEAHECRHKVRITDPPFGATIALIYLPSGRNYRYKMLRFDRLKPAPNDQGRFRLTVRTKSHEDVGTWRNRSEQRGRTGETRGGREWGFF